MKYGKLWMALAVVMVGSFAVLLYYGREIYFNAPPIPSQVIAADGKLLFSGQDIRDGQNVWQSASGQEMGTIWGHGSYVAPDWSTDWLHREAVWILDHWARTEYNKASHEELDPPTRAMLQARLKQELRTNTYDPRSGTITVSAVREWVTK